MTKPCDYCGRTDRNCENEAQVIGCDPMPWPTRFDGAREIPSITTDSTASTPAHEPTPRQRLAETIRATDACGVSKFLRMHVEDARAILAALQEADRRAMQATIDGDMPCS